MGTPFQVLSIVRTEILIVPCSLTCTPMPTLIKLDEERGKLQRLERENEKLKEQVVSLADETAQLQREKSKLAEIIRENEKMEKGDAVDDEDADEFCVVSRWAKKSDTRLLSSVPLSLKTYQAMFKKFSVF